MPSIRNTALLVELPVARWIGPRHGISQIPIQQGTIFVHELALDDRDLRRVNRRRHVAKTLTPWNEPQAIASLLTVCLERCETNAVKFARQLPPTAAVIGRHPPIAAWDQFTPGASSSETARSLL